MSRLAMTETLHNSSHAATPHQRVRLPRIGITMGDPAGIGPEVVLKAVAEEEIRSVCVPIIIGDAQLLAHTARTLDRLNRHALTVSCRRAIPIARISFASHVASGYDRDVA